MVIPAFPDTPVLFLPPYRSNGQYGAGERFRWPLSLTYLRSIVVRRSGSTEQTEQSKRTNRCPSISQRPLCRPSSPPPQGLLWLSCISRQKSTVPPSPSFPEKKVKAMFVCVKTPPPPPRALPKEYRANKVGLSLRRNARFVYPGAWE